MKIRTDQFPIAESVDDTDVVLGIVDGEDVRVPLSLVLGLVDITAGGITVDNTGHVILTSGTLQGQLDQADVALGAGVAALAAHVTAAGAHQADRITAPALSTVTGLNVAAQLSSINSLIEALQAADTSLDSQLDILATNVTVLEAVVGGLQTPTVFSMALDWTNPTAGYKYLWIATSAFTIRKVHARRTGGTGLTLNVRVAESDFALNSDLSLTTTSFTSADANGIFVTENQLVEVRVVSQSGSPTLLEVQVDFENVPLP